MAKAFFTEVKTKGRPRMELNKQGIETIKSLARIQCTDEEIASVLGVSVDTLTRPHNKELFEEAKRSGKQEGRASLRRMQFKQAEAGNSTMLIWLGKQYLEQSEKQTTALEDTNITFEIVPPKRN